MRVLFAPCGYALFLKWSPIYSCFVLFIDPKIKRDVESVAYNCPVVDHQLNLGGDCVPRKCILVEGILSLQVRVFLIYGCLPVTLSYLIATEKNLKLLLFVFNRDPDPRVEQHFLIFLKYF